MLKGFTIQRLCCYRHATNYRCFSAIKCNELRLLLCVVTGMQRITNASARSRAMNYRCWLILKGFTIQRLCCYRHATNYGCFSAIQCNELPLLMRHRAVRKNTHGGLQRIPAARSRAMNYRCWLILKGFTIQRLCCYRHSTNYGCFSAIKCNELRLLLCVVTGMQRITDASARSSAMNYRCWCAIVQSEKTHTLARNAFRLLLSLRAVTDGLRDFSVVVVVVVV